MEQHEVEEVSFLPGEAILNKKAVYEPSKSQRFRQIVCSRGVAISILIGMGASMIGIALIAAFARPASMSGTCYNGSSNGISLSSSSSSSSSSSNNNRGKTADGVNKSSKPNNDFIATNGEEFPWKHLRLPRSVEPINYDIFLHPNISRSFFKGKVTMRLRILEQTNFVVFHTHELELSDVGVVYPRRPGNDGGDDGDGSSGSSRDGSDGTKSCRAMRSHGGIIEDGVPPTPPVTSTTTPGSTIGIDKQLEYKPHQQYYVRLQKQLPPGTIIEVAVAFRGSLADMAKMTGLYKSAYTVGDEHRYMVSTHFEASSARSAFPCMDEPDLKATFTLQIVRESGMKTLFNSQILRQEPYVDSETVLDNNNNNNNDNGNNNNNNELVLDVYKRTVCMSTYLVAYVVSDFHSLTKYTKDGIMVRVWAPEDKTYMGQFALDAAVLIIEQYNKFFGIRYPLEKQDLIAVPNFAAGAMENWGLITYRDTAVLYDPLKSNIDAKKRVALVVAHELAHQWFGNLVTMKWWNDLWLNEGFASYVENIGAQGVDPNFHMFETMILDSKDSLSVDSLSSSHPIEVEVKDPGEVEAAFNSITYKKGACLINMLKGAIGAEEFHKGLNFYLRAHAYGNAETKQLWEAFEKVCQLNKRYKYSDLDNLRVSEFMDTWTKQMGYPVVTVTRDNNNLIKLTQERFLMNNDSDTSTYSWHVPFKYKMSDDANKVMMVWMKKEDASISLPASSPVTWIKGNADNEGYYIVNYDSQGWEAITHQLVKDHTVFSALDRVGFIDDAFKLAHSGRLPYSVVLSLCQYLTKESDYFVWTTFKYNMDFLKGRLYLHDAYDDLKSYMIHLTKRLLDTIGWEDSGSITQRLLRNNMLSVAVSLDYQPVVDEARDRFDKWLQDENAVMNNDLRYLIYACGVLHGTQAQWDTVYQRFQTSLVPSNKESLMYALTSTKHARLIQILLERSLDTSQIKSQSTASVIAGVAGNPNGLLFAWHFIRQNWDVIFDRYGSGSFTLASLVGRSLGHFGTQFDLDEITSFFQDKDLGSAKNAYHQTLDVIKGHITWDKLYLEPVIAWLQEFVKQNPS